MGGTSKKYIQHKRGEKDIQRNPEQHEIKRQMKKHNYEVHLLITALIIHARNEEEAKEKAILMITDDPIEYISEGEIIKVIKLGKKVERK